MANTDRSDAGRRQRSRGILASIVLLTAFVMCVATLGMGIWLFGMPQPRIEELSIGVDSSKIEKSASLHQDRLTVLTWNIHYGAGPTDDRGRRLERARIIATLEGVVETIRSANPDIVCLQEVDFDSHRTDHIDEFQFIASRLRYPFSAKVVTWDVGYVPYPPWPPSAHYGSMKSGQAVLSKHPIISHRVLRHAKPSSNPWWYNPFYLHRTSQRLAINLHGRRISIFNVHLEAFAGANRELQAAELNGWVRSALADGFPVLVMGDFNAIPRQAMLRAHFPDEPETDMSADRTIDLFTSGLAATDALAASLGTADGPDLWSFPATAPNRRLDYIFATSGLTAVSATLAAPSPPLSDHVPLLAVFTLAPDSALAPETTPPSRNESTSTP